jgi:uncharacterized membrane-anchored protein
MTSRDAGRKRIHIAELLALACMLLLVTGICLIFARQAFAGGILLAMTFPVCIGAAVTALCRYAGGHRSSRRDKS